MKINSHKQASSANSINAVCVDVIDHGIHETPWGKKPRISFIFETNSKDHPKFLTRTFNNYSYSKSALTEEIENWLDRDISGEDEDYNLQECVGMQASLHTIDALSKAGNHYDKIESINPPGDVHVTPSGSYERKDISK